MILYLQGDATQPIGPGPKLIAHVTNNIGGWGKGFVGAISKRWPEPEARYRCHAYERKLGTTQFVMVEPEIFVANMCAQDGYASPDRPVAIDYSALQMCLSYVADFALHTLATVHMPRIGCGLGGGDWARVEKLIELELVKEHINVFVYDP